MNHHATNLLRARSALATRVAIRRLRQQLEYRPRPEPDSRFALPRRQRKLGELRALDWRCPVCLRAVLEVRQWVFARGQTPCCKRCHMEERGVKEGRPRDPDPPADMVCPRCRLPKPHRGQWALKLGVCRQCARRPDRVVVHRGTQA